jgi:hypothetical protein
MCSRSPQFYTFEFKIKLMESFTTFKKYPDADEAKALEQFLVQNGIETLFIDNSPRLGSSFSGDGLKEYEIQVKHEDFTKAETLLIDQAKEQLGEVPDDHYLLTFTDEELHDVVLKHDEWSDYDYLLARRLLEERGHSINDEEVKELRKQRLTELAKPEGSQRGWIIAGYIFALLGGFFGIITGYVLWTSRKTLPNGDVVHTYSKNDREQGKIIMILGLIMLPLCIGLRILLNK